MNANENPYSIPESILDEVMEQVKSEPINRYPDPYACKLRDEIGSLIGLDREWIMVGNGSDEIISILVNAFGEVAGKTCFPVPTFPMYEVCAACARQTSLPVALNSSFDIDLDQFKKVIDKERPNLILFAFPNNPTGNCFNEKAIKEILDEANCPVVVDEAYYEFSQKTFLPMLEEKKNLLIVRTLSKVGFAGIRLGYLIGHPDMVSIIQKVKLPFNVNRLTQMWGQAVVRNWGKVLVTVKPILEERKRVFSKLAENSFCIPFPSDANFIMFKTRFPAKDFYEYLRNKKIFIKLLRPPHFDNHLRVTIGTKEENDLFLNNLSEFTK